MFFATCTMPDVVVETSLLSSPLHNPKLKNMKKAKRTLHCLKESSQYPTKINPSRHTHFIGYVDANWANNVEEDRRNGSGMLLMYGNAVLADTTSLHKIDQLELGQSGVRVLRRIKDYKMASKCLQEARIPPQCTRTHQDNSGCNDWAAREKRSTLRDENK